MPKTKTVVYVVDFSKRKLVLREEVSYSNSKKELDKMNMISSAVNSLKADRERKKAS